VKQEATIYKNNVKPLIKIISKKQRGLRGRGYMVVEFRIPLRRGVLDTTLYDQVCQLVAVCQWSSPGTQGSSNNKTYLHYVTEILFISIVAIQRCHVFLSRGVFATCIHRNVLSVIHKNIDDIMFCNDRKKRSKRVHGEMYSIQNYVIKFVSDLRQVGGFPRVPRFPPPIKLTATI
jgi:hypothetical protein